MPDQLERALLDYIRIYLGDGPWVASLFEQYGLEAVLDECARLLHEQRSAEDTASVTCFIRDVVLLLELEPSLTDHFCKRLPLAVLPALQRLLRAPRVLQRMDAIFTFGKLSMPEHSAALRSALPWYFERDPLCLARALSELRWLGDDGCVRETIKQASSAPSYLIRWALLDHFAKGCLDGAGPALKVQKRALRRLASDPVDLVRDEARFLKAKHQIWLAKRSRARHCRAPTQAPRPKLTFSDVEVRLLHYLRLAEREDYTLAELDALIPSLR